MRVFFAAYSMVNDQNGASLPEVYRRSLRVALEMTSRGHEVWVFCPGRHDYQDDLTREAEACVHFLDFPLRLLLSPRAEVRRRCFRIALRKLQPDWVVLGEAPLHHTLLECMTSAVTLGIRVAVLDNACSRWSTWAFVAIHGSMFDCLVLNGPSSAQWPRPPRHVCAVPPYILGSSAEADNLLAQSGIRPSRWITVRAYGDNVQHFAASLLPRLSAHDCAAVFVTPALKECRELVSALVPDFSGKVIFLSAASDNLLFGLLQRSSLVIGACDFTQASEALALGAPFLGIEYDGCFRMRSFPRSIRRFLHTTDTVPCDAATAEAAVRLLLTPRDAVRRVHNGRFGAAALASDFLESTPASPKGTTPAKRLRNYRTKPGLIALPKRILESLLATVRSLSPGARRSRGAERAYPKLGLEG